MFSIINAPIIQFSALSLFSSLCDKYFYHDLVPLFKKGIFYFCVYYFQKKAAHFGQHRDKSVKSYPYPVYIQAPKMPRLVF